MLFFQPSIGKILFHTHLSSARTFFKKYIILIFLYISHILFGFSFPPIFNQNMDHVNRKMYV